MKSEWKPVKGSRVEIQGLQGRADLNGRNGKVIKSLNQKTGRIGVEVSPNLHPFLKSEQVLIKPVNVAEFPPTFLEGFDVVDSGDAILGRVAVATKDYQPGDRVLVEPPTYVFDQESGIQGMIDTFLKCSREDQEAIMDMFHPPIHQERMDPMKHQRLQALEWEWNMIVSRNPQLRQTMPLEKVEKLLTILNINSHSYAEGSNCGTMVATREMMPRDKMALFARGSKVQHSCAPNLNCTTDNGKLEYLASRAIYKGDRLTFSYQSSVYEEPLVARREFLKQNKSFTCQCPRCMAADECNPTVLSCSECKNAKAIAFAFGNDNTKHCIKCRSTLNDTKQNQKLESDFSIQLDMMQQGLENGTLIDSGKVAVSKMIACLNDVAGRLHPFHHLHPKGYSLLSSMAASFARLYMKRGGGDVEKNLIVSTLTLLFHAEWVQRAGQVVHGDKSLDEAIGVPAKKIPAAPTVEDIQKAVNNLDTTSLDSTVLDVAHSVFHAGQTWLLIPGQAENVANFYKAFLPLLQRWNRMSDEIRKSMFTLIESGGTTNQFKNHLNF